MIDIDSYLNEVTPTSVLNVINEDILTNFLNGYSYKLYSGINVVYPTERHVKKDEFKKINAFGEEATDTFQGICAYWRKSEGCNQDDYCNLCDRQEALLYFEKKREGLRIFRCKPLSLWDMTYPIIINNRIIGVLFAGQIAVDHGTHNWKNELKEFEKNIDWNTTPEKDNHLEVIKAKINSLNLAKEKKKALFDILDGYHEIKIELYNIKRFIERISKFKEFGELTQKLMEDMYKPQKDSAERKLIGQFSEEFASINFPEVEQFWLEFSSILQKLCAIPEIENVKLYTRDRSRYIQYNSKNNPDGVLLTYDVMQFFPNQNLIRLDRVNEKSSIIKLITDNYEVYGYRSDSGIGHELCSTLVVIYGKPEKIITFLEKICEVICATSNLALQIYRERQNDQKYQKHVSNIGHSFRTPLYALSLVLEKLKKEAADNNLLIFNDVIYALNRIKDAKQDLEILLEPATKTEKEIDIIDTLIYIIDYMEQIAGKHPCKIVLMDGFPEEAIVFGNEYEIRRAFINLLDNAIKYSYRGESANFKSRMYEVRISIFIENNFVTVTISNYGIGIPQDKLKTIKEYGFRANIPDEKKVRTGTGLGLPYAIEIIEKIGGLISIESTPSSKATKDEIQNLKRHITQVRVLLPIQK